MAWQEVRGRRSRARAPAMRPELAALAQELRAHLLGAHLPSPGKSGRAAVVREEWTCASCATTNWLQRRICRTCRAPCGRAAAPARPTARAPRLAAAPAPPQGQRLPPCSVWAPCAAATPPSAAVTPTPKEQAVKL